MSTGAIILTGAALLVIVLAVIFRDSVKAQLGKFKIQTDSAGQKNTAKIKGNKNITKQGMTTDPTMVRKNTAKVKGDENDTTQG